jgi:hypothetical protein
VEVDADPGRHPGHHLRRDALGLVGQRTPVGVAQDHDFGARRLGGVDHPLAELGFAPVAVEEVLGVEEDP